MQISLFSIKHLLEREHGGGSIENHRGVVVLGSVTCIVHEDQGALSIHVVLPTPLDQSIEDVLDLVLVGVLVHLNLVVREVTVFKASPDDLHISHGGRQIREGLLSFLLAELRIV